MLITMAKHQLDPNEQRIDHQPPGNVAVSNLRVQRGMTPPPGTSVEDAEFGIVSFDVTPPQDDRTLAAGMGYRIRHVQGSLPEATMIPDYDVRAIRTRIGAPHLVFYWHDGAGAHPPIHFHLSVAAVDLAGNVGPTTYVDVSDPPALATPALVSPPEGAHLSGHPRMTTVVWNGVPEANQYFVEVEFGNRRSSAVVWTRYVWRYVQGTSWTFQFVGAQPGRWRVTALDTTGARQGSHPSPFRTFDYTPQAPVLPTPALVSPADGARFSHYPRTTTLIWDAVPGADQYQVDVEYASSGPPGLVWASERKTVVTGTSLTFDFVGAQPGRWRVTALNSTGAHQQSAPSPFRGFDYTPVQGTPLPSPVLVSPADGARFSEYPRTTTLIWDAVPGADQYQVDVEYASSGPSGLVWASERKTVVTGTSLTFDFVGAQPGRWRVTALDVTNARQPSPPSAWRGFSYSV